MYACTLFCTNSYTFQKVNIVNLQENHEEFTVKCFAEYIQPSDVAHALMPEAEKSFFQDPILTPMQPYRHCSQCQFTNVTNCTKFVTFLRRRFTMKLQEKHNEFQKNVK